MLIRSFVLGLFAMFTVCAQAQTSPKVKITNLHGAEAKPYQEKLSDFYNVFYQDPPYRYHAKKSSWDSYIASYVGSAESIIVLASSE